LGEGVSGGQISRKEWGKTCGGDFGWGG
jgi:hypothetical protein